MDPGPDVAGALGYGDVGEYRELPPGTYAVSIRPAGTPAGTPPASSVRVEVPAGGVRTLALSGPFADLALTPLTDELRPPGEGTARIRVLAAASAPDVQVGVEGDPPLPGGRYTDVPAGSVSLRLTSAGTSTSVPLDLRGGTVVTLLVLDAPDGGLTARAVLDAVAPAAVPVGAVEAGGSAPGLLPTGWPAAGAAVLRVGRSLPVSATTPVRVRVPGAGVDAVVTGTGLGADGALAVPADPSVAGWYAAGPPPGERGPAVLTGHVDWAGRPAVFAGLAGAEPGDEIVVDRADGSTVRFVVDRVLRAPKAAFPTDAVYGPVPGAELRLITCGGEFDPATGSYTDNVVVFARAA